MIRLLLVSLVVLASTTLATPVAGSAQQAGIGAEIRQGNCDDAGDVVAPLDEARLPSGDRRGNAAALPAPNSFTTVPISLGELTASDHVIVVPFPAGDELVACGDIGGTLTEAGPLVIGLSPQGDVGISGIAYLNPSADPAQTTISLFVTGEGLDTFLTSTFLPLRVVAEDAARFAAVLADRDSADRLAGPLAGRFVQRGGEGAGVSTENFSATVTFVNPTEQTETPWDVGLAFHQNSEQTAGQAIAVRSDGFWYYQDAVTGALQVAPQTSFDATPGATNTLDLVVEGTTALFGLNGEFMARIDLPPATASDVFVTTGFFAENIVEGREIVYTDFVVWKVPAAGQQTATPGVAAAPEDATRFAAALAARSGAPGLAGPFGGTLGQRQDDQLTAIPAGITTEDFSATVTFVNPSEPTEATWDYGLAFHQTLEPYAIQEVYVDANGFWYYSDFPNGVQQSGTVPALDATPGGMNTLDLIVDGSTALFGVNGEFVASIDLPPPTSSDVLVATDFRAENIMEGREIIYSTFEVWDVPTPTSLAATQPSISTEDDAARFSAALAARFGAVSIARPLAGTISDQLGGFLARGAGVTTQNFSATVTFVNPQEPPETPWDYGFAFHRVGDTFQSIYVDSDGFWYYQGTRSGFVPAFDATPGATNTLDLVVEGNIAQFGVNREFVSSIDLPPPTASDVYVGTSFFEGHDVEGREIRFRAFEVWR